MPLRTSGLSSATISLILATLQLSLEIPMFYDHIGTLTGMIKEKLFCKLAFSWAGHSASIMSVGNE
jgi:hypothetical protein